VAPTITSADNGAVDEDGKLQVIYTVQVDDNLDTSGGVILSLEGQDAGSLILNDVTGQVTTINPVDYEAKDVYNFTVVAVDAANNRSEQEVSVSVGNLDEVAPTITSAATGTAVDENSAAGQVVYTATADDSLDISAGITYSLKDESLGFSIDSISGEVTTNADFTANYDAEGGVGESQSFTVVASDGVNDSVEQLVTVAINNLDEVAPTITSSGAADAIDENSGAGQIVYTAVVDDSADISNGITFSLADDANGVFTIDNAGNVRLIQNPNHEVNSTYSFTVVATDDSGLADSKVVTLEINDGMSYTYSHWSSNVVLEDVSRAVEPIGKRRR
jgi:hypothetical protein